MGKFWKRVLLFKQTQLHRWTQFSFKYFKSNLKLFRKTRGTLLKCLPVRALGKSWGRLREAKHWLCPISLTPLTLLELKSPLTFSPLVFESSFSFFLAAVINSLNKASRSFIFSIALNLESLACLAANSLKVVLQQNGKWTHLAELSGLWGRFSREVFPLLQYMPEHNWQKPKRQILWSHYRVARPMNSTGGVSTHTEVFVRDLVCSGTATCRRGRCRERLQCNQGEETKKKLSCLQNSYLFCGLAVQAPVCPGISQLWNQKSQVHSLAAKPC